MNDKQKEYLLDLAKKSITTYLETGKEFQLKELPENKELLEKRGAFVTLHLHDNLRGCIGYILPYKPLYQTVIENAYNAAFEDPRFNKLTKSEYPDLEIEISVLSAPKPVASYKDIIIGKHGILLKCGHYQAVFLPQVAVEQGWDLETTLTHLSLKASGDPNLWRLPNAQFEVLESEIIK